jgi:CRP/FNR family transcriptional regulator, cyclic AMP receptor protein
MIPVRNMHNFFDALPAEVQAEFVAASRVRRVVADHTLVHAGDSSHELFQLVEGTVKCCPTDHQGRAMVATQLHPGDWIGLTESFTGMPALCDVVTCSPVKLRVIPRGDFDVLTERYPVVNRELVRLFSLRFSAMYHLAVDRSVLTIKERLLKLLYTLSFSQGPCTSGQDEILIRFSQEELSKMLAASRQNLNRALKELEREGVLALGYGGLKLNGLDGIRRSYGHLVDVAQPAASYG